MQTLKQAMQTRLDERRRAREAAAQAEAERIAAIERREAEIAADARRVIEQMLDCELGEEITVEASYNEGTDVYYNITLNIPGEFGQNYVVTNSGLRIDGEIKPEQLKTKWRAVHIRNSARDCSQSTFDDLLTALIFAKYGMSEPEAL